ncbi:hypothetical protein BDR03DRAFT_986322 [Suillus americanus]|nr:hypothetical protein BDR03DRAFT_986321 [Suillus americanus]KAG2031599.1 hypothetical protein BDR03DRAFT_986322 [Suillus americanus]
MTRARFLSCNFPFFFLACCNLPSLHSGMSLTAITSFWRVVNRYPFVLACRKPPSLLSVNQRAAKFSDFFPLQTMRFAITDHTIALIDLQISAFPWPHQSICIHRWPEEYYALTHSSCNIPDSSGFLKDICAPFCGVDLKGILRPIWVLKWLKGITFNPAAFPTGFPPPAPIPVDFPTIESITFPEMLLPLSLDFDHNPTIDLTVASMLDNMFAPVLDDDSLMSAANFTYHQPIDEVEVPHEELHWREILRDNPLDSSQKKSLKLVLLISPWGRIIRLARYLYMGQLITASFLRALHLNLKTYQGLCEEPLMVVNNAGSETRLGWSNLRNRIQQAITDLIVTQGFQELLWASFFRPIADFADGQA